jgi:high affinity cGMP-specific 3',5'-cyclic phosphodiesterase 9
MTSHLLRTTMQVNNEAFEFHRCNLFCFSAVLFTILSADETNILKNLPDAQYREARKNAIKCILATDMAKHGEIMASFKKISENFNYDDPEHRILVNIILFFPLFSYIINNNIVKLMQMIIKCSDISNEGNFRP